MARLYIFGNGFDCKHGLSTNYHNFSLFMRDDFTKVYQELGNAFFPNNPDMLWSDFENNMGKFDPLVWYMHNQAWCAGHNSRDLSEKFEDYQTQMQACFELWIKDKEEEIENIKPILDLSPDDYYINFNYTEVLEQVYGIPSSQILHIHGDASIDRAELLVVGHGLTEDDITTIGQKSLDSIESAIAVDSLTRPSQSFVTPYVCADESQKFLTILRKDTESIIAIHAAFFAKLRSVNRFIDEVVILGHSLFAVDVPYFRYLSDNVLDPDTKWKINIYPPEHESAILAHFKKVMAFDAEPVYM